MHIDLARTTLKGILALDQPIGQLMEFVRALDEGVEKATLKECCGTLLRLQFDLIEHVVSAYPELREEADRGR